MKKFLRTLMLAAAMLLPFVSQSQNTLTFDFEDGLIPSGWTNASTNPWVVTDSSYNNGHQGAYCIMSGNAGISSSQSSISATFTFVGDGSITFLAGIFGEGTSSVWDHCTFKIDGQVMFDYGARDTWEVYTFELEAGTHSFEWFYDKDGSVNPTGDAFYLDSIVVNLGTASGCPRPGVITVSNVTGNTADISWIAGGTETSWNVYLDSVLAATVSTPSYSFTGLSSLTNYQVAVAADCGTEQSTWRTTTFTTGCTALTLPYTETFEATSATRDCWNLVAVGNIGGSNGMGFVSVNGRNVLRFSSYSNASDYNQYGFSPLMDVSSSATNIQVSVVYGTYGSADVLNFGYVTATDTVWDPADYSTTDSSDFQTYTTVIPATATQLAIHYYGNYQYYAWIDTVSVIEMTSDYCFPVTNLTVSNITADGATLTWTGDASSYTIVDLSDSTTVATITDTTYTFTTLNAMTQYSFGVVANCSTSQSNMVNATFATACTAVELPYTETFEATSGTLACWTTNGPGNWNIGTGDYSASTGAFEGSTNAKITHSSSGNVTKLISPVLDGVTSGMTLDFAHIQRSWSGDQDELRVYYRADADSAWIQVAAYTDEVATWTVENVVIPGTVYQVAFEMTDGYGYGVAIDSVVFTEMGASYCYTVTNLAVDSVTSSSIFLSWNDNNNAGATYSIYGADGSVIASGISTTNYEVTGLSASTSYTFGVVANCSATDASNVVTVSASTSIECAGGSCFVELNGADSYGDGWNGNAINVMQNGNLIETFTLATGTSINSAHITVCSGAPVVFTWVAGSYPGEASFEIKNAAGMIVHTGVGSTSMATGDTIFVLNNACPSCLPVTNLSVTAATETSITLSWNGTADSYDIYNDTTFVANVTTNSYTFTGLTSSTSYTFGVMALCSATDSADMVTINATTPCPAVTTFPYIQDFATMPSCWTIIDADGDGFTWENLEGAMHSASYDNSYGTLTPDNWLITPSFQLATGTNYEVTWNANPQDTNWASEHYGLYVSTTTTDTSAFTLIQDWTLTPAGHVPVIDLSSYAGQTIYLAFRHWNCTNWFRVAIDNFQIREAAGANQVTVTLRQNNPMYGSVAGGGVYTIGDSVTVTATPATGYQFIQWISATGAVVTANPYTFVATTDVTLQAIFDVYVEPDSVLVNVAVNDTTMGTTIPAPGVHYFYEGDTLSVIAVPNTGYHLTGWTFSLSYNGMTFYDDTTINVEVDDFFDLFDEWVVESGDGAYAFSVTANFAVGDPELDTVIVNITADATMGTTNPLPGTHYFTTGQTLSVEAIPYNGYFLNGWVFSLYDETGEAIYEDEYIDTAVVDFFDIFTNTLVVGPMLSGYYFDIMPIFSADTTGPVDPNIVVITFAVNDATMGTITPSGTQRYELGSEFSVTATPAENCYLVSWTLTTADGISVTLDEDVPLTFTDTVIADMNGSIITANFARNQGIDDVETSAISVYTQDDRIIVKGVENLSVNVYDVTGRNVKSVAKAAETVEFTVPSAGVYMVKASNGATKRVVVVR